MFQPVFNYLKALKAHNNREWFEAHRSDFEKAKALFSSAVDELITGIGKVDPDILPLAARDCVFRQYRDIRFSNDKTPYKTHMGAYLNRGGKKINTAGYYLHLEPGASILAGGLYHPEAAHLQRVRQEIDYNFEEWKNLLKNKKIREYFPGSISTEDSLKRPPRGYEPENPAMPFLKLKSFIFTRSLPDQALMEMKDLKNLVSPLTALTPVIQFLNRTENPE